VSRPGGQRRRQNARPRSGLIDRLTELGDTFFARVDDYLPKHLDALGQIGQFLVGDAVVA